MRGAQARRGRSCRRGTSVVSSVGDVDRPRAQLVEEVEHLVALLVAHAGRSTRAASADAPVTPLAGGPVQLRPERGVSLA